MVHKTKLYKNLLHDKKMIQRNMYGIKVLQSCRVRSWNVVGDDSHNTIKAISYPQDRKAVRSAWCRNKKTESD